MLIKPGKVSRDYIDGKRQRYTNPFRFYLTISIIFFLLIGLHKTIEKYQEFTDESIEEVTEKNDVNFSPEDLTVQQKDSLKNEIDKKMKNSFIPVPKKAREKILEEVDKDLNDTLPKEAEDKNDFNIQFGGDSKLDKFITFVNKNPDYSIDKALDTLGYEKSFFNRFLYTRAKAFHSIAKDEEPRNQFFSQLLSYGSIALFLLLPVFTLFLRLFYIRRKFTYVDHLIFVFHTQTVFFMLFSIYFLLLIFGLQPKTWIFTILFLLYLFLAMKNFYKQRFFKTFFKFVLVNMSYGFVAMIGISLLFIVSFALF